MLYILEVLAYTTRGPPEFLQRIVAAALLCQRDFAVGALEKPERH